MSVHLACKSLVLQFTSMPVTQVPDDILQSDALNEAVAVLPANYNFEVTVLCLLKGGVLCKLDHSTLCARDRVEERLHAYYSA